MSDEKLAIDGGSPAVAARPPSWPLRDNRIRDVLLAAWEDGSWGQYHGAWTERVVQRLADMHGVEHVQLCCSGTFAVELALRALKVKPADEVILAAYDFPGNFRAVEAVGAKPVLVDIDPANWCLDPQFLATAAAPNTRAVIVSHLHGGIADMQGICKWAHDQGVSVVEDACQAPGALAQQRPAGCWGDIGVLSFGGSKLLTAGRGGAILTSDAAALQRAKIYGERGNESFPMSQLQAAALLPQLETLAAQNQQRRVAVRQLIETCRLCPCIEPVNTGQERGLASYYKVALYYDKHVARGRSREQFIEAMRAEGIALGAGFRGFVRRGVNRCRKVGSLHHARRAAESTVLLHHPALLEPADTLETIFGAFKKVARHFTR